MLEQGEVLTLDNNKDYVVVSTVELNNINYVYLINPEDMSDMLFCAFDKEDGLYEVEDSELFNELLNLFNKDLNGKGPQE